MEQNQTDAISLKHKNHKIICENRKNICITGVQKADTATPTHFQCIVMNTALHISGQNLSVKKLDTTEGVVELVGDIDKFEYAQEKKSLLKRIFK